MKDKTLSERPDFGQITHTLTGQVRIEAQGQLVCLPESDYWVLMEMISEASIRLVEKARRRISGS